MHRLIIPHPFFNPQISDNPDGDAEPDVPGDGDPAVAPAVPDRGAGQGRPGPAGAGHLLPRDTPEIPGALLKGCRPAEFYAGRSVEVPGRRGDS